jgi:hypothetical protein
MRSRSLVAEKTDGGISICILGGRGRQKYVMMKKQMAK